MPDFGMPVRDLMSPTLIAVRVDTPLDEVGRILEQRAISAVAVKDRDGVVVGLLSLTDLLRHSSFEARREGHYVAVPAARLAGDIMKPEIVIARADAPVHYAASLLVQHRIHRVFVEDGGPVVGVLSTRDIMRAVLDQKLEGAIRTMMSSPALTIELGDSVDAALAKLEEANVRGLVVVDGRAPVGVFTQLEALKARALPPALREGPVENVMSYETICLDEDTPLYRAAGHALAMNVRRILAVKNRELTGILTGYDLVRAVAAP